ncbi:AP2-ERF domain [Babesia duncani]|uniref:AP2-ERF domain n=1 Tax=Babesia duncani TaxID=323732 RepID=A0AAD9UQ32_9APIC|nr:AP2-ERF domain [Babesia duncani]
MRCVKSHVMATGEINNLYKDSFMRNNFIGAGKDFYPQQPETAAGEDDMTNQVYIFLLQMKLLNTLDLIRAVCPPWGTLPHGNDYVYHFNQIANCRNLKVLHKYESVFSVIYNLFERVGGIDPSNLWADVSDVDYFRVIYHLECLRLDLPFDNQKYIKLLEQTLDNIEGQVAPEENNVDYLSNENEIPPITKYNWQSQTHSYSLCRMGDAMEDDNNTVIPSDTELDIFSAVLQSETNEDLSSFDSDLVNTDTYTIDISENYDEQIMSTVEEQMGVSDGEYSNDGQVYENFSRLVLDVLNRSNLQGGVKQESSPQPPRKRQHLQAVVEATRKTKRKRKPTRFVQEAHTTSQGQKASRLQQQQVDKVADGGAQGTDSGKAGLYGVVSAYVSYDKRQQRFMAQWKTREGTKHSKSFYAKRYATPLMARKHAELYKMYILQHRNNYSQGEMEEPTYEQLAAQDFQPLETISITDLGFMDEFESIA